MKDFVIIGIGAYLLIQLAIAIWVSRKTRTESDFLVAGRSLTLPLVSFSIFATWFGSETVMGSSANIFEGGLSASRAEPFGYALVLWLIALLFAKRLYNGGYLTLADLYKDRFGAKVERLAVIIYVPTTLIWAAAQLTAFGMILSAVTGMPIEASVIAGAILVIFYTMRGGLIGDVYTDFIQGIVIIIGLFVLLFMTISHLGGFESAFQAIDPAKLTFLNPEESLFGEVEDWMITLAGGMIAPEILARIMGSKNLSVGIKGSVIGGFIYLIVGAVPMILGLVGGSMNLTITENDQFLPILAQTVLNPFLYVIFMGALISAILSTVDSILITASGFLAHNLLIPALPKLPFASVKNKKVGTPTKLFLTRMMVVVGGIAAYLLTLLDGSIYEMVEWATSYGMPGLVVITFVGLWGKKGGSPIAGISTLLVGLFAHPIIEHNGWSDAPFTMSLLAALITYVVLAQFTKAHAAPARTV